MTKIICLLNDGNVYFDCTGHTGYQNEETGNNDVCVAISTLCCMLIRYMDSIGIEPQICKDGHVLFNRANMDKKTITVFKAARMQLEALQEDYPDHVKIYL